MIKYLVLIICFLFVLGCTSKGQINTFEAILGKSNADVLTYLVDDFENDFLQKQYPNLTIEEAYVQYLIELDNDMSGNWKKPSISKRIILDKNNLKYQIYALPDSVWLETNQDEMLIKGDTATVKTRWKYINEKGSFDYAFDESSISRNEPKDIDSLLNIRKKYIDINYVGKYRKALKAISKNNKFVKEYIDYTDAVGNIDPRMIAGKMLMAKVDVSDYFIKRLIITEIIY